MRDPSQHGAESAFEAMLEVADRRDIQHDFGTVASAFRDEDLRTVVDLAWRYQFSDDRSQFKRDIRGLQEVVGMRVLGELGVEE